MKRKNRLSGVEIRKLRSPRRVHGGLFSVLVASTTGDEPRCSCVVSKKVAASAARRNTIKRRCREALTSRMSSLAPGAYIFHAKKDSLTAPYRDIESDITRLVQLLRGAR